MSIEILQLRLFLEVVAAGSVSGAARRANIVQSALSRRMQMLESSLGTSLFVRHADGVVLTEAGRRLQFHAEKILEAYREVEEDFGGIGISSSADIKLGITKTMAVLFAGMVVVDMHRQLPNVRLRLIEGPSDIIHDWLHSREIDFAVMTSWKATHSFEFLPLWRERLFLVMPPDTEGDQAAALAVARALPFIVTNHNQKLLKIAAAVLEVDGSFFTGNLEVDALPTIKQMVQNGFGFTILPYYAISDDFDLEKFRVFPLTETIARYLVRRTGTPLIGASRRFISLLPKTLMQQLNNSKWVEPLGDGAGVHWDKELAV